MVSIATDGADVLFLVRVACHVVFEVIPRREALGTDGTFKWLVSCMFVHVDLEGPRGIKLVVTDVAAMFPFSVYHHVSVQLTTQRKRLTANLTHVFDIFNESICLLPAVCLSFVCFKLSLLFVFPRAVLAFEQRL